VPVLGSGWGSRAENLIQHRRGRNLARVVNPFLLSERLISAEEECFVLADWTTDISAELVPLV
jgi:hypothetical protein